MGRKMFKKNDEEEKTNKTCITWIADDADGAHARQCLRERARARGVCGRVHVNKPKVMIFESLFF